MTKRPLLRLKPREGRRARAGAPWIFSNEIASDLKSLPPGALQIQPSVNSQGDSRAPDDKSHESDATKRQFKEDPWFAKLPPDVRNAMRAKSHRPAPRVYEDRLKKYFENIEK